MNHLRRSYLLLIILVCVFFNIQRLRVGEDERLIDFQNFVYLLALIIMLVTSIIPAWRRVSTPVALVVLAGVYLLCKLVVFSSKYSPPLYGDYHTYVSIAEYAFLALTTILAHDFEDNLHDFESAVENITLADAGGRMQELGAAAKEIQREVMRSRRYNRALSVIIVEPVLESNGTNLQRIVQEVQKTLVRRYMITSLGRFISQILRRTDLIVEQAKQERFIIVCPELDAMAANQLLERIQGIVQKRLGIHISYGIGSFPEGRTFNELVSRAELALHNSPAIANPRANLLEKTEETTEPDPSTTSSSSSI